MKMKMSMFLTVAKSDSANAQSLGSIALLPRGRGATGGVEASTRVVITPASLHRSTFPSPHYHTSLGPNRMIAICIGLVRISRSPYNVLRKLAMSDARTEQFVPSKIEKVTALPPNLMDFPLS